MSDTGKYIVIFKQTAKEEDIRNIKNSLGLNGGTITNTYDSPTMKGFAGSIPATFLAELQNLQDDGIIDYIEPDQVVTTQR